MTLRLTTRLAVRPVTRLAVGYTPPGGGPDPGTPVISIVGGGALLPGTTISSDTSLPWLADGVQIAPASLSLELPWAVAPGAVITQPESNALTVSGYHSVAASWITRREAADDASLEQPIRWYMDGLVRELESQPAPKAANNLAAIMDSTAATFVGTGSRTHAGAMAQINPSAASITSTNYVSGDWHRTNGLAFGASKFMDGGNWLADTVQDDLTLFAIVRSAGASTYPVAFDSFDSQGGNSQLGSSSTSNFLHRSQTSASVSSGGVTFEDGFFATSRSFSSGYIDCHPSGSGDFVRTSELPANTAICFGRLANLYGSGTYSIAGVSRAMDAVAARTAFTRFQSRIEEFLS